MSYKYTQHNIQGGVTPELVQTVRDILTDEYQSLLFQTEHLQQVLEDIVIAKADMATRELSIRNLALGITRDLELARELHLATMTAINNMLSKNP